MVHGSYAVAAAINRRVRVSIVDSAKSQIVSGNQKSYLDRNDGKFSAVKSIVKFAFDKYGVRNRIQIAISSNIPRGSGLGSSAAVSAATAAALLKYMGVEANATRIYDLALNGERNVHGNPSGIDVEASIRGGAILFSRREGAKLFKLDNQIRFLVIFSGVGRKTSELIARVAKQKQLSPFFFDRLTTANSFLSLDLAEAMRAGDLERVGALMNLAQVSLSWIGVSTSSTDMIIEETMSKGALGAKITGAGGGGSVIALPLEQSAESVLRSMAKKYSISFLTAVPEEGLRWEN